MARMYDPEQDLVEDYGTPYGTPYVPPVVQPAPAPAPAPTPTPAPAPAGALPGPTPTPTPAPAGPLSDPYAGIANAPTLSAQVQQAWAEAQANPLIMQGLAAQGITSPEQLATLFPPEAVPGVHFYTNAGRPAGVDGTGYVQGYINYDPNGQYRLVDKRTGETVYEGSGYAGLDEVQRRAAALSAQYGTGASWAVDVRDPATGQYVTQARDEPKSQIAGQLADIGLPALLAAVAVATGGLGLPAWALAAAGSAGGSGLSSAIQGRGLEEAVLRAVASGAAAGAGAALAPGIGGALDSVLGGGAAGSAAGGVLPAGVTQAMIDAGEVILVNGSFVPAAIGGGLGAFGGNLGQSALEGIERVGAAQPSQQPTTPSGEDPPIVVTGTPGSSSPGGGLGFLTGGIQVPTDAFTDAFGNNVMTVEGTRPTQPPQDDLAVPVPLPPVESFIDPLEGPETTINVTGEKSDYVATPGVVPLPDTPLTPSDVVKDPVSKTSDTGEAKDDGGGTLSDIANYLRLASLVTGLGGSLLGGKNKKKNLVPGGLGGGGGALNPIFGGSLPTNPSIPGTGGLSSFGPRQMPAQDWELYGTRPEQSFYTSVPQTYTPPAPGVFDAWSPYSRGYALGGAVEYAEGGPLSLLPGGGRADDVPAMLSNGEYVIDAETVALLGDGSFDEGSRKLDSLRVNVRKHKGRDLAKGRISPDARPAERYLGAR